MPTTSSLSSTPAPTRVRNLIVVLGDQLSPNLSSLRAGEPSTDLVLMMEVDEEASYVRHHKKKIAYIISAMRHFAGELRGLGWRVAYRTLEDTGPAASFSGEVVRAAENFAPERIVVTQPGEWRVAQAIAAWSNATGVAVDVLDDDRFICSGSEFAAWAADRRQMRMEYFYRDMRRKTGLLMRDGEPIAGQWNFDRDNRRPARPDLLMPRPRPNEPDAVTGDVLRLVAERFGDHFGDLEPFWFAVTRDQAEAARDHFIADALPRFGDFQDAMLEGERFLYHSVLSIYINSGLLDPLDVCRRVEAAYLQGAAPLNAAEGFIRQIIGWREYVRGIYWQRMPGYRDLNYFAHDRPLPDFYWTGETKMACLRAAITQTREEAYAHHIQRLMLTGTFALLAGVSPQALHEWYLIVYADAYEWVELPNTLGMSQFADGGLLGSKPYAASGAYIDRMSNYCKGCHYNVKQRTGPDACPFNALYWSFLARHQDKLGRNPRMVQMYKTYERFAPAEQSAIADSAAAFLSTLVSSGDWP